MIKELVPKPLPKIEEVYQYPDVAVMERANKLNVLLNQEPNKKWLKPLPMNSKLVYIPIEVVEYLLTTIFIKWRVEIKEVKMIAQSVVVSVRLHVCDPTNAEWTFQDGVGAAPIQTDKGCSAADLSKVKNNAIQLAAPAAESYAVKDAAEKFGKLFGKDLNRSDAMSYDGLSDKEIGAEHGLSDTSTKPSQ